MSPVGALVGVLSVLLLSEPIVVPADISVPEDEPSSPQATTARDRASGPWRRANDDRCKRWDMTDHASGIPRAKARRPCYSRGVIVVHVQVHVVPDQVEAFREATLTNARASVQEPGIARFDVLQRADDPTRFVLIEVYRTAEAPAQHKETAHYLTWRDAVAPMMASPRSSLRYDNLFPDDGGW